MLVPHHVEGIVEVVWDTMSLFFFYPLLRTFGIALLSLFVGFSIEDRFVVADIEDQISLMRWKNREARETQGVWGKIQVVVFVLGV